MNCTVIQRRLLGWERPDEPPPDVRAHLDGCGECRAVQRRLLQLESEVRGLPVPPSRSRGTFVLEFLSQGEVRPLRLLRARRGREGGRQKAALAVALAAGLAVFALGWWAWPRVDTAGHGRHGQSTANRPDRNSDLRERLAAAHTPSERVRRLSELADELHREAQTFRTDTERLKEVAAFYSDVIGKHLLSQARQVAPADRAALLKAVIEHLQRTESEASRVSQDLKVGAAEAAVAFNDIALAARNGSRELLLLSRRGQG
jgi:hypothetical protein